MRRPFHHWGSRCERPRGCPGVSCAFPRHHPLPACARRQGVAGSDLWFGSRDPRCGGRIQCARAVCARKAWALDGCVSHPCLAVENRRWSCAGENVGSKVLLKGLVEGECWEGKKTERQEVSVSLWQQSLSYVRRCCISLLGWYGVDSSAWVYLIDVLLPVCVHVCIPPYSPPLPPSLSLSLSLSLSFSLLDPGTCAPYMGLLIPAQSRSVTATIAQSTSRLEARSLHDPSPVSDRDLVEVCVSECVCALLLVCDAYIPRTYV
jgi:hypothetical protein